MTVRALGSFGRALLALRFGRRVRRASWPEHMHLRLVRGGAVIQIVTVADKSGEHSGNAPWIPTQQSLLATDWERHEPQRDDAEHDRERCDCAGCDLRRLNAEGIDPPEHRDPPSDPPDSRPDSPVEFDTDWRTT